MTKASKEQCCDNSMWPYDHDADCGNRTKPLEGVLHKCGQPVWNQGRFDGHCGKERRHNGMCWPSGEAGK